MCISLDSVLGATGWAAFLSTALWLYAGFRFLRRQDRRRMKFLHEVAAWLTMAAVVAADIVVILRYQFMLPTEPTRWGTAFAIGIGMVAAMAWIKAARDWRG